MQFQLRQTENGAPLHLAQHPWLGQRQRRLKCLAGAVDLTGIRQGPAQRQLTFGLVDAVADVMGQCDRSRQPVNGRFNISHAQRGHADVAPIIGHGPSGLQVLIDLQGGFKSCHGFSVPAAVAMHQTDIVPCAGNLITAVGQISGNGQGHVKGLQGHLRLVQGPPDQPLGIATDNLQQGRLPGAGGLQGRALKVERLLIARLKPGVVSLLDLDFGAQDGFIICVAGPFQRALIIIIRAAEISQQPLAAPHIQLTLGRGRHQLNIDKNHTGLLIIAQRLGKPAEPQIIQPRNVSQLPGQQPLFIGRLAQHDRRLQHIQGAVIMLGIFQHHAQLGQGIGLFDRQLQVGQYVGRFGQQRNARVILANAGLQQAQAQQRIHVRLAVRLVARQQAQPFLGPYNGGRRLTGQIMAFGRQSINLR